MHVVYLLIIHTLCILSKPDNKNCAIKGIRVKYLRDELRVKMSRRGRVQPQPGDSGGMVT